MEENVESIPPKSPLHVDPTFKGLLRCFYGFNQLEIDIFSYILQNDGEPVKQLSQKFNRDESVVYRALQRLCNLGLVKKEQVKEGVGRPYFLYHPIAKKKLKEKLMRIAETWYETVKEALSDF